MSTISKMSRKDWNLMVLSAAGGKPLTAAQLQKCLFLVRMNLAGHVGHGFYRFVPYLYGPFCKTIYSDAEELGEAGLVNVETADGGFKRFSATPLGIQAATGLLSEIPAEAAQYVKDTVDWARSLPFPAMIRAIYNAYPAYRANSIFRD